jgi:predicted metal-dependent peptidase
MELKNKDIISQAIVNLFESERFYAELICQMRRFISNKVPTAGVCIRDQIELYINPEFFEECTPEERVAVLKHECEHILRGHISRAKDLAPEVYTRNKDEKLEDAIINQMKHKTLNVSMDCAINSMMKNLPKEGVFPKMFDLKNGETMEWYLNELKDNEKAKELMEFDDHALWSESDGDKEILKEKIRQAVNKAAKATRAAGRMTYDQELLVAELNKNVVNWRQQLKRFAARTIETALDSSKKKRNRRYGVTVPGTIKTETLHIGVAIDTSGSVSDESLKQFMSEIGNIAKYAKVTVVEADAEIKNSYEYDPRKKYKIAGRGGTAYKPAFDFFNKKENQVDAIIYFGDMDCWDIEKLKKPKYPVLWAIVGNQNPPADFGAQIRIEVKE